MVKWLHDQIAGKPLEPQATAACRKVNSRKRVRRSRWKLTASTRTRESRDAGKLVHWMVKMLEDWVICSCLLDGETALLTECLSVLWIQFTDCMVVMMVRYTCLTAGKLIAKIQSDHQGNLVSETKSSDLTMWFLRTKV